MTESITSADDTVQREARWRRGFVWIAVGILVLGALHFVDHVIRGALVVDQGLNPDWNHSGWPFQAEVNPFTFSLAGVTLVLVVGLALTVAGRAWAGYWLAAAVVLLGVLTFVHLLSNQAETLAVIAGTYGMQTPAAFAALLDLLLLVVALLTLAGYAVWVRRASGRW